MRSSAWSCASSSPRGRSSTRWRSGRRRRSWCRTPRGRCGISWTSIYSTLCALVWWCVVAAVAVSGTLQRETLTCFFAFLFALPLAGCEGRLQPLTVGKSRPKFSVTSNLLSRVHSSLRLSQDLSPRRAGLEAASDDILAAAACRPTLLEHTHLLLELGILLLENSEALDACRCRWYGRGT
jgi:hypothetical protein